jgi:glycosyltransferase involved in cell wall biosynthesis
MNLLYLTTEDIGSALFENQVLENLYGLLDRNSNIALTLFVLNKPSHYFKHQLKIKEIDSRIKVIYVPLSPPMRFYTATIFLNKLYIAYISTVLRLFVNLSNYDVIHCRHYLPSLVCLNLGVRKIHFDVRSLSLFEYVQAGKIRQATKKYMYWREQERSLVLNALGISVVSRSMIPYLQKYSERHISYCPIIVNPEKVYFCSKSRASIRRRLDWEESNIYVYSGSFGLYGLNKEYLARLIRVIWESDTNAKFMFLISNSQEELLEFLELYEIAGIQYHYHSAVPDELYKYLSAGDVGIHALPRQLDAFSRLGTKVVEYWCCGMPTVLNNNVGEAADISNKHQLGYVVDLDGDPLSAFKEMNFSKFDRNHIRKASLAIFNKSKVLDEYENSYRNITGQEFK